MNHIRKTATVILSIILLFSLESFKPKADSNLWQILEKAFKEKARFTKSFQNYNQVVREVRQKAFTKFNIPLDTSKITTCFVINQISLGSMSNIYGKIIINDSIVYNYYEDVLTREIIAISDSKILSDSLISSMVQKHQFIKLQNLAEEQSKDLTGDYVYYIAYYNKNWDCTYAKILPAFIKDDPNYR